MCTIALATRVFADTPITLGANREERYDRPADPPAKLGDSPIVFGPTDTKAGGTWIGINEHGLLAAVTNRPGGGAGERSRGWLVRDILACDSVQAGGAVIERETSRLSYDGFNLLLASPERATVWMWDDELRDRELPPGIHTIVNEGVNEETTKSSTIRARLQAPRIESADEWETRLRTVLQDHGIGACLHGEEGGTRSSSLLQRETSGAVSYQFAEGPPCEADYRHCLEGVLE